jgi:lysophospholipase L1-like esterase
MTLPPARPPTALRVIGALWLGFAALATLGLAGELWLRIQRERTWKAAEHFRAHNVFFANNEELNAAQRNLWRKPWLKYEPGARAELTAGGEHFVVAINSLGYRTHEFSPGKPAGTLRVLCLGGSTTVAGRTNDETYPALLEAKLRQRYPGVPLEVLDLGVSGTTTARWLAWLDKLLAFDPDVVVQYEAINDIAWLDLPHYAEAHPLLQTLRGSLLLERLLGFDAAALDPEIEETLQRFAEMDRRCRERDVRYLTASFAGPDPERLDVETRGHLDANMEFWTQSYPLPDYATYAAILARHNARLQEFTARRHIDRVLVDAQLRDPALFIDACHLTPTGIERLATAFLPEVASLLHGRPGFPRSAPSQPTTPIRFK